MMQGVKKLLFKMCESGMHRASRGHWAAMSEISRKHRVGLFGTKRSMRRRDHQREGEEVEA
jgi:hypothetical protein